MPNYVTHHIFATTVQRVTRDAIAHIAALYPAAYRWGAQGPDPLFYYHMPFPSAITRLAQRMHAEPPDRLFEALCAAAQQQHDTAALAYVFGFCTHYTLDRVTHPLIQAEADRLALFRPGLSAAARHNTVESDLDGVMIAEYITNDQSSFEAFRLLDPNAAECTVFARTLSLAAKTAYGMHLSPAAVYRSLHDTRRVFHLAHGGLKARAHVERLERLVGRAGMASSLIRPDEPLRSDCANVEHRVWQWEGQDRTDSFFDLFDSAVPLALSLQRAVLDRYYQEKPLDSRFFPTDFNGIKPKS